ILRAVATDSAGNSSVAQRTVIRRDDRVPPTARITGPAPGSVISVGPSDVVLVIDSSLSTNASALADVDGDGTTDSILEAEVQAARVLLDFLDPTSTRVAVVDFNNGATLA